MWVGDSTDLDRLITICRELQATSDENSTHRNSAELIMEATVKAYGERLEGTPEQVVALLDRPQDVKAIRLTVRHAIWDTTGNGFRLVLDKDGATATITGETRDWIDLAKTKLERTLLLQRPWYYWTHTWWFGIFLLNPILALGTVVIASRGFHIDLAPTVNWILVLIPETIVYSTLYFGWARLLPKFELFRTGERNRGTRTTAVLGGVGAWIIGSIVVPLILR
jgi:hypothetical protein